MKPFQSGTSPISSVRAGPCFAEHRRSHANQGTEIGRAQKISRRPAT
jgi:hypothetical protein